MANEVKVKKVKAYPFPILFKFASGNINGAVVKLTLAGFLAEVPVNSLKTGEKFDVTFELPVMLTWVNEPCVLVKIYTQWAGGTAPGMTQVGESTNPAIAVSAPSPATPNANAPKTQTLIEVHFQSPSGDTKARVTQFLNAMAKR